MTYKFHITGILTTMMLCACSSIEERSIASGSFEYVKEQPGQKISIPDDVNSPEFNEAYKLPELGENASTTVVGQDLSIFAPSLVLPIVAGSHIEEGSKSATVWFDQVYDEKAIDEAIWDSLIRFLESEGHSVEAFDKDTQRMKTGWMVDNATEESSWYSVSDVERTISQRFEFSLDVKPHGRTAALSAKLLDYKENISTQNSEITQSKDVRRNEVEILNKIVKHYEFETTLASVKRYRKIREGLDMELGVNNDGDPAFVVKADYDVTWPRLLLVLRQLGFDVKDYDKSNGLLFVKYNGSKDGWWSNIWSNDKNEFDLDTEEYRIKVAGLGQQTSITMLDEESQPFPVDKLTNLYPTFSKNMSDDDLDI